MSSEILDRFDQLVRKRLTPADASWRIEQVGKVIRAIGPSPSPFDNSLCWAEVDEGNADAVIQEQIAFFQGLGHDFMWKVYSHDVPHLTERLLRAGFELQARVTLVALDTNQTFPPVRLPPGVELRRVEEPSGLRAAIDVQQVVWKSDFGWLLESLTADMKSHPERLSVFVGWAGERPVCSGWFRTEEGTPFGGLWGGSVLEEFRGKGLYRAMVQARAEEARARHIPYLIVEAGDMSRPILQRLGFRALADADKCIYRRASAGAST
jgi:GNAT superfamily N-acetyltransferase